MTVSTEIIRVRRASDVAAAAAAGAAALREGKLVGFPTETVYGIAAVASRPEAMRRLRKIKSRPRHPFTVHLGSPEEVARYIAHLPGAGRRLIERTWPGPVTVLAATKGRLADKAINTRQLRKVLCARRVIGLRCPDEPVAAAMLSAVDEPVVAPSANVRGAPSPHTGEQVAAALDGKIDLLIDAGSTRFGTDSSIVRLTGTDWQVVREGAVGRQALADAMRVRIVFVCTGNTCRSPMAAGLARAMLADRLGCSVGQLAGKGYEVSSAGVFAAGGSPATAEARQAAGKFGADLSGHRSQKMGAELIKSADMVLCMTQTHVEAVRRVARSVGTKIRRLDEASDIPDPIGGGAAVYRKTATRIRQALRKVLKEHVL